MRTRGRADVQSRLAAARARCVRICDTNTGRPGDVREAHHGVMLQQRRRDEQLCEIARGRDAALQCRPQERRIVLSLQARCTQGNVFCIDSCALRLLGADTRIKYQKHIGQLFDMIGSRLLTEMDDLQK